MTVGIGNDSDGDEPTTRLRLRIVAIRWAPAGLFVACRGTVVPVA